MSEIVIIALICIIFFGSLHVSADNGKMRRKSKENWRSERKTYFNLMKELGVSEYDIQCEYDKIDNYDNLLLMIKNIKKAIRSQKRKQSINI
jgi:hypothetical protein